MVGIELCKTKDHRTATFGVMIPSNGDYNHLKELQTNHLEIFKSFKSFIKIMVIVNDVGERPGPPSGCPRLYKIITM